MTSASDVVHYQGKPMDRLSYERLHSQNMMLKSAHFGGEKSDATLLQGIGGYVKSGGTHLAPGGCYDLTPFNHYNRTLTGRLTGGTDWYRPPNWDGVGGGPHVHCNTIGGPANPAAKAQWTAYYAHRNGLRNNAADPGPRLTTKPLFVAPWTDRGRRGVYYLKKGFTGRSEGSTKAKSTGALPAGAKLTVVAVVNVGGTLWGINKNGVHVPMSNLSLSKTPTKPPTTQPDKSVTLHVGNINVIRWRLGTKNVRGVEDFQKGLDYKPDRVAGFAKMQDAMGMSIFATEESGQYADADAITAKLGSSEWDNVLHGDDAGDITEAIHWFTPKRKVIKSGRFSTAVPSSVAYHDTATWVLLEDIKTTVRFMVVAAHSEYRARGTTMASSADLRREKQTANLIKQAEVVAAGLPIVFIGDFNQDADDFYDGPGRAMKAAGYVDTYAVATSKSGPETTINGLDPHKTTGRRLDRIFVKTGTEVGAIITVPGYPNTDHNGVAVGLTLVN